MRVPPELIVSIHDVMPDRLDRVERLLERVAARPVYLLVVPGLDWRARDIDRLRGWVDRGHRLAGHGWRHRIERFGGLRHRLHGALISRRVAEHLERDADGIVALMTRCRQWFPEHGLSSPSLYVPPAWALGRVPVWRLGSTGFTAVETLSGIVAHVDTPGVGPHAGEAWRFRRLPLLGYEVDTRWRALAVRASNGLNRWISRWHGPIRFGLHPDDLSHRLAGDIERLLDTEWRAVTLESAIGPRESKSG